MYTAYEFLEARFDVRVRTLAAGIFIIWRLGWMATAIYVPCLAINAATSGPLFGIYLLAMFSRRATGGPTLLAGVLGTLTSYVVAYHSSIGFMWPSTFGLAATLVAGYLLPLCSSTRPAQEALRLTWRAVVSRPGPASVAS